MPVPAGAFSFSGDTRGADDSARINCGDGYPEVGELGRDVVFHLPFNGRARVDATLSPEPGFDAFLGLVPRVFECNPTLSLRLRFGCRPRRHGAALWPLRDLQ